MMENNEFDLEDTIETLTSDTIRSCLIKEDFLQFYTKFVHFIPRAERKNLKKTIWKKIKPIFDV